jgi:hypothetical protein
VARLRWELLNKFVFYGCGVVGVEHFGSEFREEERRVGGTIWRWIFDPR